MDEATQQWTEHLGDLIEAKSVLALTRWTELALREALQAHRVLRLQDDGGHCAYLRSGFDADHPARPLAGLEDALEPWAEADPQGWIAASWFMSPQVELGGRTPREALHEERTRRAVAILAQQAAARFVT